MKLAQGIKATLNDSTFWTYAAMAVIGSAIMVLIN